MVVLMPSVGQAVGEAEGAPSEVATQATTEVILLPTSERAELSASPVASTTADVAQSVEVPPMEVKAMVATTDGSQP